MSCLANHTIQNLMGRIDETSGRSDLSRLGNRTLAHTKSVLNSEIHQIRYYSNIYKNVPLKYTEYGYGSTTGTERSFTKLKIIKNDM